MFGVLKIKTLLFGLLLTTPPIAAWAIRTRDGHPQAPFTPPAQPALRTTAKIPVEVVTQGIGSQTIYVEAPAQAIPEPGLLPLAVISTAMLFQRRRAVGN